ncbi:hypothetical protein OEZ86_014427 [Tetradesmus obliquus]|uniref:Uncharacterized protein n=1 Tax=Tetradesmus obliquus TaxID=3088 RepID=A0ABY8U7E2_TETOB|nr:hypothetical protein OEZ85_014238 [Tetradesmus obliquus]WIA37516.1 hypothetical protein OEZ86_014427 [Tetradesmus obliquus]
MSNVVYTCGGVELREFSGETFSTIVHDGTLTVKRDGNGVSIDVAGNAVAWVPSAHGGPFKRVDTRSFQVATTDLMGSYYVTLPKGLPEAKYEHLNAVLTALKEGGPIPAAAPLSAAPVAAAAAPAAAPAGTSAAGEVAADGAAAPAAPKQGGNPFGDLLGAIAQKAQHDTLMLGKMIQQKAQHDMASMQDPEHKTA